MANFSLSDFYYLIANVTACEEEEEEEEDNIASDVDFLLISDSLLKKITGGLEKFPNSKSTNDDTDTFVDFCFTRE